MARKPLRPLVRSGGFYPSRKWTPLVYAGGYTTANGGGEPTPPPIEKTVIGNPIHILDALAKPVQALSVKLEPIQDLHGYDNPWPAGGGKNKLPNTAESGVHDQVTYTVNADGTIKASGTSNGWNGLTVGQCTLPVGTWVLSSGVTTGYTDFYLEATIGGHNYSTNVSGGRFQFTLTEETTFTVKLFTKNGSTVSNVICYPMVYASGLTSDYEPYSNICPISGRTSATVTRTGKNLLALMGENTTDVIPTINETTGEVSIADTTAIKWASKPFGYSDVVAEQTYIFSTTGIEYGRIGGSMNTTYPSAGAGNIPDCTTSGGDIAALVTKNATARTFTPHFTGRIYWHFCTDTDTGSSHQAFTMTPMIELGSTASSFEPYRGTTYPIPLGQTVYGGTLDVTSGKLTVDRAIYDFGAGVVAPVNGDEVARTQGLFSAYGFTPTVARVGDISAVTAPDGIICNQFVAAPNNSFLAPGRDPAEASFSQYATSFYVQWSALAGKTNAEAKTLLTGVQILAPLATPITIQLTPTQVELLQGENNLWSDGEMTLVYLADGNASDEEALNILLGGRYVNNHTEDEPTDREALDIVLGGNK